MTWEGKGSTRRWRALRLFVLSRDGGVCQLQLPGRCLGDADQVHHLEAFHGTPGTENPSDLVAACGPCNRHVGDPRRADPAPTTATTAATVPDRDQPADDQPCELGVPCLRHGGVIHRTNWWARPDIKTAGLRL